MLENGYAEIVPKEERENKAWYIPHFGVTHPEKPGKVRVVFDCAAKIGEVSLNDMLISGPDILNLLLGVLLRFRTGKHAFTADIKTMFYQVRVPAGDRDFLRFLWWSDDNCSQIEDYRICVHLFGASSSPSIANFALRRVVADNISKFSVEDLRAVERSFYVDDCLHSENSIEKLTKIGYDVKLLCGSGGFELTKYVSPCKEFLKSFVPDNLGKGMEEYLSDASNVVKGLGMRWDLIKDMIVHIKIQNENVCLNLHLYMIP